MPELFEVIYADPPWRYDNGTPGREIERHYPTMTHEEICGLDVPVAKNAVLFLWGVAPKLPEALEVMTAWGFTYRTGAVWDKELVGMGYWFRSQHEHLLVGVRGNWSPPPQPLRVSSVYRQARGRHSKKPDIIRNQIATWWPDARRLEMFCRYPAPGWHVWGNQVDSTAAGLPFDRFDPTSDPGARQPVRRRRMSGEWITLIIMSLGGIAFILTAFREPGCPKGGHHEWGPIKPTLSGWSIVQCAKCGYKDIT